MNKEKELPKEWVWTTLGDVTAPTHIRVQPNEKQTLPYIGMEHVESETMKLIGIGTANELKSSTIHFWPGDVLYGRLRPYLNKVFRPDFEGLCSPEFLVFRESPNLNSRYLQYYLNSWSFKEFASQLVEGDRPRVDWDQLKVFSFPLAPLGQQQRIVATIERHLTRLETVIATLQQSQARLKLARSSALKSAIEGKLTQTWRAKQSVIESASTLHRRILLERRTKWELYQLTKMIAAGETPKDDWGKEAYKEPATLNVKGLPALPDGWCWATLEQIGDVSEQVVLTGPFGSNLRKADFVNSGVPVLTIGCLTEKGVSLEKAFYVSENKAKELERYKVKAGDLLFSRMASVGRAGLVNSQLEGALINYHLMRIRLENAVINPNYFIQYIRGSQTVLDYIKEVNHGVTRDGINTKQLLSLPVSLPPLAEQEQIVNEVDQRLSIISQLETTIVTSLRRAERFRQSILKEVFAGWLVPQEPGDEPASILLKRIREERKEREQAEQLRRKEERKVNPQSSGKKKTAKQRITLVQVLVDAKQPLPPDELLRLAGLLADDVDEFYEELREAVSNGRIKEVRQDTTQVLLEAVTK